jgi:membrane protease YdiL (CAAX protease family)
MSISISSVNILPFILAFSVSSFGYILFYVLEISGLWQNNQVTKVIFRRISGVFIFGFIPMLLIRILLKQDLSEYGLAVPGIKSIMWTSILAVIIIPVNYYNSKSPANLLQYPQIRTRIWSWDLLILSALSWIAYMFAYEFLFRGFLLFSAIHVLGVWPAVIINTGVYSLVHIPKGLKETLGAIPFGMLLCFLSIKAGNIWIAFFSHCILALSNEWFSLRNHPEINLSR